MKTFFLMMALAPTDAGILNSAIHSSYQSEAECIMAEIRIEQLDPSSTAHVFCVDWDGLVRLRMGELE